MRQLPACRLSDERLPGSRRRKKRVSKAAEGPLAQIARLLEAVHHHEVARAKLFHDLQARTNDLLQWTDDNGGARSEGGIGGAADEQAPAVEGTIP